MNFQMVSQVFGQKDEKGYQASLTMFAKLLEIGAAKLASNNKPYVSCKMMDDNNETHSATIRPGSKGLPTPDLLGKRCMFSLQPYQGQQGIAYSGFCNGLAAPGAYSPPQGQQTPQQPRPAPNAPSAGQFDQEKTTRASIERQTAWRGACDVCAGFTHTDEQVLVLAYKAAQFIATGDVPVDHTEADKLAEGLAESPDEQREAGEDSPNPENIPY